MKTITAFLFLVSGLIGSSDDYHKCRTEFEQAVEQRNFVLAKKSLNDLLPLLKADLKKSKSEMIQVKKSASVEDFELMKLRVGRKSEIYKTVHHLIDVSPAAIRAKSSDIISLLNEYEQLS